MAELDAFDLAKHVWQESLDTAERAARCPNLDSARKLRRMSTVLLLLAQRQLGQHLRPPR